MPTLATMQRQEAWPLGSRICVVQSSVFMPRAMKRMTTGMCTEPAPSRAQVCNFNVQLLREMKCYVTTWAAFL